MIFLSQNTTSFIFCSIYFDDVPHAAHAGADEEEGSSRGAAGAAATGCGDVGVRHACEQAALVTCASTDNRGTTPRVNYVKDYTHKLGGAAAYRLHDHVLENISLGHVL